MLTNHRHFLPFGRADLTASAVLQPARGNRLQRPGLRLAAAATSAREISGLKVMGYEACQRQGLTPLSRFSRYPCFGTHISRSAS
ncbi:MAG: hypothetical protein DRH17_06015 [Deltaproteobacteria bacterium]|nr:MAG: hypothetical protein DRH17_06015 [Deltaproteobacteria bacterium]